MFGLFVCVPFRSCPCAYVFAQGDEGIVGLSYQYKDDTGNMVAISRGKVKDAKRQFAHQVQLRLCMQCNPNISVKVFKTGRLQIAGCKDEGTCNKIVRHVINCLNNIYHHVPNGHTVFERHVCEPSGQHVAVNGPIVFSEVLAPETVNINCTFDAGYSFVGYTVDPLLLRQIVSTRPEYAHCVKSVEYTPEKRYAGVKILFKPPTSAAASGDPAIVRALDEDPAGLGGQMDAFRMIYILRDDAGEIDKVVLPIEGYGLWSTLFGFIALEANGNDIFGLQFYQHGETPGLGAEIDNPRWKALWNGKKLFTEDGTLAITVAKAPPPQGREYYVDALAGATLTSRGVDNLVRFWMSEAGYGTFLERLQAGDID